MSEKSKSKHQALGVRARTFFNSAVCRHNGNKGSVLNLVNKDLRDKLGDLCFENFEQLESAIDGPDAKTLSSQARSHLRNALRKVAKPSSRSQHNKGQKRSKHGGGGHINKYADLAPNSD